MGWQVLRYKDLVRALLSVKRSRVGGLLCILNVHTIEVTNM